MEYNGMKLFLINCNSDSGSVFVDYVKSVVIAAENSEEALAIVKENLKKELRTKHVCVSEIKEFKTGIIFEIYDKDY